MVSGTYRNGINKQYHHLNLFLYNQYFGYLITENFPTLTLYIDSDCLVRNCCCSSDVQAPPITSIVDFAMVGRNDFPLLNRSLAVPLGMITALRALPCMRWSWKDYKIFLYSSLITAVHCLPSIRMFYYTPCELQYCFLCAASLELLVLLSPLPTVVFSFFSLPFFLSLFIPSLPLPLSLLLSLLFSPSLFLSPLFANHCITVNYETC